MRAFSNLSNAVLETLAYALDSNQVSAGNSLILQQYVPTALCQVTAEEIEALLHDGLTTRGIARLIRAIVHERQLAAVPRTRVEVVWSGPDANGSSTRETGVVVRELFKEAKQSILLAGFAIYQGRTIFKELCERMSQDPSLAVQMFLNISRARGDTTMSQQLLARFIHDFRAQHWMRDVPMPAIFYDPRALERSKKRTSLHAKCVVIDRQVSLVTSANFTEAAQERNIEVGALITDTSFSSTLATQFELLIQSGALVPLPIAS